MFNAIVTQKILSEKRDEFESIVKELEYNTLKNDDGCLRYEWYRSEDKDTYYVIESWADEAAVQAHLKAPHFTALLPKLRECVPGPFSFTRIDRIT